MVERQYGFTAVRKRVQRTLLQYTELAEDLPREIRPILAQLRKNKLAVNLEHKGLHDLTRTIEHASRNIAFSLIVAAMLIGSSILVLAAQTPGLWALTALGIAGFVAAAVLTALIIISNRRGKWYR
jgi:ubiquinone biosynthesis protein